MKTKLVKDASKWKDMAGDTNLEKKINSFLTWNFITRKDVPADECLNEAKFLILTILGKKK